MRHFAVAMLVVAGLVGTAGSAQALPISCPGTAATTDREFTVDTTPTASCLATGIGNINGNGDAINALGYITLDKSDDGTTGAAQGSLAVVGTGTTSGSFTIAPSVYAAYSNLVIAFKSGEGQFDPDWAAFSLPAGVVSGTWAISQQQSLSHVNLYGVRGTTTVPEPATMLLFGATLVAAGVRARRRS